MYIPVGRRTARRPLGRVADFCPLCRGFRPFRVFRSELAQHFYNIAVGARVPVGFAKRCESCGLDSNADPANYRSVSHDPDADLDRLIAETNPEIGRTWAARMLLEDRIQARKLSAGERSTLLREPFAMAEDVIACRNAEGTLDLPSQLGCLGSLAVPVACLLLLPLAWNGPGEAIETATVVVAGLFVGFTFLAIMSDARRHAKKAVVPRLVASIRPLDPSQEEVEEILASLRAAKSPLAEVVGAREISNALLERWD